MAGMLFFFGVKVLAIMSGERVRLPGCVQSSGSLGMICWSASVDAASPRKASPPRWGIC
ncbi:MAG TPA: hypothetical protein H9991_04775 [Candidatus Mailhella excrementigallinarum]|nr:hypothetical protein [Candidatus Mailhella excrementigallinarum]